MSLRFLILNADYPEFLLRLYGEHRGLESQPFAEQMQTRMESLFGMADFYSSNLRRLGHEAWDVLANNEAMQKAWARGHGMAVEPVTLTSPPQRSALQQARWMAARTPLRHLKPLFPYFRRALHSVQKPPAWFYEILTAQIKHFRPDVLWNQEMGTISPDFLKEMKPYVRMLVGQHAATRLNPAADYSCYDLVISSFPPTVDFFRERGIPSESNRLAFEPRALAGLEREARTEDLTFVGSFYLVHSSRTALLEKLCARFPQMKVYGPDLNQVARHSPIRRCYGGQAWGREMYRVLRRSRLTLNHHGDVLPFANNMRLYEATGAGALLVTDWKANLHEMFEPGREVVAYRSAEECAELIEYYLQHDDERQMIARAGQQRTLQEHTYYHRVQELMEIIGRRLAGQTVAAAGIESRL
jgi:hypothetical protein